MNRRRNAHSFTSDRAREAARKRWATPHRSEQSSPSPASPQQNDRGATRAEAPERLASDHEKAHATLVESLQSSSQIARIQAARELLSRKPVEPEPVVDACRGISLAAVVELAVQLGVVDAEELVLEARRAAEEGALSGEGREGRRSVSVGHLDGNPPGVGS
jgi:hypothetical protein